MGFRSNQIIGYLAFSGVMLKARYKMESEKKEMVRLNIA